MNAKYLLTWGIVVGFGLGAVAISGLKAQTKPDTYDPPGYVVVEVTFKNQDEDKERYIREFFPQHIRAIEEQGGIYVVLDGKPTSFRGSRPGDRVVIMRFPDMAKAKAWYNSPDAKAAEAIGDKYADFKIFAVAGIRQ
jgi:uncharacterized protein (DUF1330 family)